MHSAVGIPCLEAGEDVNHPGVVARLDPHLRHVHESRSRQAMGAPAFGAVIARRGRPVEQSSAIPPSSSRVAANVPKRRGHRVDVFIGSPAPVNSRTYLNGEYGVGHRSVESS